MYTDGLAALRGRFTKEQIEKGLGVFRQLVDSGLVDEEDMVKVVTTIAQGEQQKGEK